MSENSGSPAIGRRGFLAATAAVALTAGCGEATDGPGREPAGPGAGPPVASGSSGTVLGPVADVPVNGGKVYPALEVVVTQPATGKLRGFSAVCTHTGCIVDKVADGTIDCPCHGSRYRLDGTVMTGPAPRALTSRPVRVDAGQIVLA